MTVQTQIMDNVTFTVYNLNGEQGNNYRVVVEAGIDEFVFNYTNLGTNEQGIVYTDGSGGIIEDTSEEEAALVADIFDEYPAVLEMLLEEWGDDNDEDIEENDTTDENDLSFSERYHSIDEVTQSFSKENIAKLIGAYSRYVVDFYESHDEGSQPVSFMEFFDNDYCEEEEE